MRLKTAFYFFSILVLGLALASCERMKISDINADPGRFTKKEVIVAGQVTQSIGASFGTVGGGLYQIDDGTGTLWVFCEGHGVPSKGARVGVKGHIQPTLTFLGRNYATVLRETNRHAG